MKLKWSFENLKFKFLGRKFEHKLNLQFEILKLELKEAI